MTNSIAQKNIVVYADDDQDDIDLVDEAFRQFANNVKLITFQNGHDALSFLKTLPLTEAQPCLIILDINMPLLNGKEVLVQLREVKQFENTPVVLFTTSSTPADKSFAQEYKAGFITKPLDFQQMEFVTRQFIDHCSEETQQKMRS